MKDFINYDISKKLGQYIDVLVDFVPKAFLGIVIFFVGIRVINRIVDFLRSKVNQSSLDAEIRPIIISIVELGLKLTLFFVIAGTVGIETSKFMAVMGAAVFAIGMGLQGSLGHFAAGMLILIFRPYRVGDVVEVQGQVGIVREIHFINTHVELFDKKMSIIPNGIAVGDIVTNHSYGGYVRVDTSVAMPYSEDFDRVEAALIEAIKKVPKVLSDPPPFVGIEEFDSHNVKLALWSYSNIEDYWEVLFAVNKNVKRALSEKNIKMAYSEGIEMGDIGK